MDVKGYIDTASDFVKKSAKNPEQYQAALTQGQDAIRKVALFLDRLKAGNAPAAKEMLTEWADVNATLQAIADVKSVNDNPGVELDDVLYIVQVVAKIAFTVGKAAL